MFEMLITSTIYPRKWIHLALPKICAVAILRHFFLSQASLLDAYVLLPGLVPMRSWRMPPAMSALLASGGSRFPSR